MTTSTNAGTAPTTASIAQDLANVCYLIATSNRDNIAQYDGPVYSTAHAALRAIVTEVYGADLVDDILEILVDCGESLDYCAGVARERVRDRAAQERDEFMWRMAAAIDSFRWNGLRRHMLESMAAAVDLPGYEETIYNLMTGNAKCACGLDHPEWADVTYLTAVALVLGVELPSVAALSSVSA